VPHPQDISVAIAVQLRGCDGQGGEHAAVMTVQQIPPPTPVADSLVGGRILRCLLRIRGRFPSIQLGILDGKETADRLWQLGSDVMFKLRLGSQRKLRWPVSGLTANHEADQHDGVAGAILPASIVVSPPAPQAAVQSGAGAFLREIFDRIGGWPLTKRGDFDQQLIARLHVIEAPGDPCQFADPSYIFRWSQTNACYGQAFMQGPEDQGRYEGVKAQISNSRATLRVLQGRRIAGIAKV
jgi:hypothetical protein